MDGNNRWSKINNKSLHETYKLGANKLFKISNYLFNKRKIKVISAFAFSINNQKRSKKNLLIINKVINDILNDDFSNKKYEFKINFIGDLSFFSSDIQKKINQLKFKNINSKKILNVFLNYGGQEEIIEIINHFKSYKNKTTKKDIHNFFKNKYPDPDLLIRTGGFQRLSNFILYQVAFTEFFFIKKLWPDLKFIDIEKILYKYSITKRKFGK